MVVVGHDWGGALAFDWAARHPQRVSGVAFLESIVRPMEWDDLVPAGTPALSGYADAGCRRRDGSQREPDVTSAYTGGVLTPISDEDMAVYLAPYDTPESRRPILAWARQMPLGGEPAELVARIDYYDSWLADSSDVTKLLMTFQGSPTLLIDGELEAWCERNIASLEIVPCGTAGHHAPEDRPVRDRERPPRLDGTPLVIGPRVAVATLAPSQQPPEAHPRCGPNGSCRLCEWMGSQPVWRKAARAPRGLQAPH